MIYWTREEVERIGKAGAIGWVDAKYGQAHRYLSHFWLYLEEDDEAFTPHHTDGFWESWITAWMSQQFDRHDIFVDVGANVGYYTMLAGKHGIKTVALEPNQKVYKMLDRARELNKIDPYACMILNVAASDEDGYTRLMVPDGHSGAGYIGDEGVEVRCHTLDNILLHSWVKPGWRVFVKIDAEGAENKVLAGMHGLLEKTQCTVILEWETERFEGTTFADDLFQYKVSLVDYRGHEKPIKSPEALKKIEGIRMIVIRNYEEQ